MTQHFDTPDPKKVLRNFALLTIALLFLLITFLSFTAEPDTVAPSSQPLNAVPASDLNATEKQISLSDGRTVTCLHFEITHEISCDWSHAKRANE